jgi:hypothetical protein
MFYLLTVASCGSEGGCTQGVGVNIILGVLAIAIVVFAAVRRLRRRK